MAANAARIERRRVRAWSCLERFQAVIASDFFMLLPGEGLQVVIGENVSGESVAQGG